MCSANCNPCPYKWGPSVLPVPIGELPIAQDVYWWTKGKEGDASAMQTELEAVKEREDELMAEVTAIACQLGIDMPSQMGMAAAPEAPCGLVYACCEAVHLLDVCIRPNSVSWCHC